MIRGILLLCLTFLMACGGCATTTKNVVHEKLSAGVMATKCSDPVEVHNVPPMRFPIPAQLSRHHGCQGVEDMLAVMWPAEATKTNIAAAELLMMMYIDYQNEILNDVVVSTNFIKRDSFENDGRDIQVLFYEIIETPVEKIE